MWSLFLNRKKEIANLADEFDVVFDDQHARIIGHLCTIDHREIGELFNHLNIEPLRKKIQEWSSE